MKKTFFIERLDEGYTLTQDRKTKAIETKQKLEDLILVQLRDAMANVNQIQNMAIQFEVSVNSPKVKSE